MTLHEFFDGVSIINNGFNRSDYHHVDLLRCLLLICLGIMVVPLRHGNLQTTCELMKQIVSLYNLCSYLRARDVASVRLLPFANHPFYLYTHI